MRLDRTNTSLMGRWWWTIDRQSLFALLALVAIGAIMVTAASPPVAQRLDLPAFYFVQRQQGFLALGVLVMIMVSFLSVGLVKKLAFCGLLASLALMLLVPLVGVETKGAHRWISIAGIVLQPSEFLKPCFAVVMAWICAVKYRNPGFPGHRLAIGLYALSAGLLIIQPDLGMTMTVTVVWGMQYFLAGLPLLWAGVLGAGGVGLIGGAYAVFPHVRRRIDSFLDPAAGDNYQVGKSLEALRHGGMFGRGPGEGQVKQFLPDSHTDFVFSVAGEELGLIACIAILGIYAFIVLRGLSRVWGERDVFVMIAVAGLLVQFGVQAMINMGVAVGLLPAKGMTLPFISYGGSSMVAIALGMGMMLALTRRKYG